jgi:pilus assembly protein CpaC
MMTTTKSSTVKVSRDLQAASGSQSVRTHATKGETTMNRTRQGFATLCMALMLATGGVQAAPQKAAASTPTTVSTSTEVAPPMALVIGKSTILRLPVAAERISVGNPVVADVILINPRELYLLGKDIGSTNLIVWSRNGVATVMDITVSIDAAALQARMRQVLPEAPDITVDVAFDSVILRGEVADTVLVDKAVSVADAFIRKFNRSLVADVQMPGSDRGVSVSLSGGRDTTAAVRTAGARIVNMLTVSAPQQVLLEVKVAEVSKSLLEKLGAEFSMTRNNGDWSYGILTEFLSGSAGAFGAAKSASKYITIDAAKEDGLIKILAEPNIMAISGKTGKFLAGGRIFIPVERDDEGITLEERDFGVRLAFTPTVLSGGRINLQVAPEVSELQQSGNPFTTIDGVTSVLPSFTVRNAETTVQLNDGQSFAIAGLIKNNTAQNVKRLPVLGEIPILGALFRSSEFQSETTELMFVVTPRLVKPLPPNFALPTDAFIPPTRAEFFLGGQMEGRPPTESTTTSAPAPASGFEMK